MHQAVASAVHSNFGPRDIRPLRWDPGCGMDQAEFNASIFENYADLQKIGLGMDALVETYGMDALQGFTTTPSIGNIVQFLQEWLPGFVRIQTQARKIDNLIGIMTAGSWEDEQVVQQVVERTGGARPYGDATNVPFSSFNQNFEYRTIVRFEEGLRVGRLEEKRSAKMRLDSAGQKRDSAAWALEIQRNAVGFVGYNSGANFTYGFLNDPNLPAYVTVAAGVLGTTWAVKTYLEITADIRTAIVALRTNSGDTIDPEMVDITLAISTNAVDRLSVVSNFGAGNSVRDWLRATYPRVRVQSAPELNSANGGANVFYLFAEKVDDGSTDGGQTFIQVVPSKFTVLGVQALAKGFEEDYTNATAGVMLKRPYAVTRFSGI